VSAIDWTIASRQLLRALRGPRSQVAFSRRLGFRSNIAAAWEGGHRAPSVPTFFDACERVGVDLPDAMTRFHPAIAPHFDPQEPAPWLRELRGDTSTASLADALEVSPSRIRRWMAGRAHPRLETFLALVDALTGRASDLVACLVDIDAVPELADRVHAVEAARRLAIEHPWSAAIRVLVGTHRPRAQGAAGALGHLLDVGSDEVQHALDVMLAAGTIALVGERLCPVEAVTVDLGTLTDAQRLAMRQHWARAAGARAGRHPDDAIGYSVVAVGPEQLEAIRETYRRANRRVRTLVAGCEERELAALLVTQVLVLDEPR